MELVSGVIKEDYTDYILYFSETLSDELKQEIRSRLVAVCYGVDQASSGSKIYSYKATVKEFIKRYKASGDASEDRKKGMIGELLVHVILEIEGRFTTASPFLTWKNEALKKDLMYLSLKKKLAIYGLLKLNRVKSKRGRLQHHLQW